MRMEAEEKAEDDSDVEIDQLKKPKYSVDDITMDLEKQMKISKKKASKDTSMDLGTKTIKKGEKISALRQKRKSVKSRS